MKAGLGDFPQTSFARLLRRPKIDQTVRFDRTDAGGSVMRRVIEPEPLPTMAGLRLANLAFHDDGCGRVGPA